jgi:hypothetical protein
LQANDVCIELLDRMAEVMNLQTTRGPQALHAFVNVVSGDFEGLHLDASECASDPRHTHVRKI